MPTTSAAAVLFLIPAGPVATGRRRTVPRRLTSRSRACRRCRRRSSTACRGLRAVSLGNLHAGLESGQAPGARPHDARHPHAGQWILQLHVVENPGQQPQAADLVSQRRSRGREPVVRPREPGHVRVSGPSGRHRSAFRGQVRRRRIDVAPVGDQDEVSAYLGTAGQVDCVRFCGTQRQGPRPVCDAAGRSHDEAPADAGREPVGARRLVARRQHDSSERVLSNSETYLWRVDVKTGEKTPITRRGDGKPTFWFNARFSNDGKKVYAISDRGIDGTSRIWRCEVAACAWTPVTPDGVMLDLSDGAGHQRHHDDPLAAGLRRHLHRVDRAGLRRRAGRDAGRRSLADPVGDGALAGARAPGTPVQRYRHRALARDAGAPGRPVDARAGAAGRHGGGARLHDGGAGHRRVRRGQRLPPRRRGGPGQDAGALRAADGADRRRGHARHHLGRGGGGRERPPDAGRAGGVHRVPCVPGVADGRARPDAGHGASRPGLDGTHPAGARRGAPGPDRRSGPRGAPAGGVDRLRRAHLRV